MRRLAVALLAAASLAACESREVQKDLRLVNVHTGWYDSGIVEGGLNKLVPSISLELENVSERDIASVQINAVFRRVGEEEVSWGDHFVRAIDSSGLRAGSATTPIVLRSSFGYTGSQARIQMLQNKEFVDAKVEIFGRHGRRTWAKMGEYQIERQLLTD
ncbi:MAG: hypothetical protein A3F70_12665 [Acidobacteria bacterium RIFCSPLOWO2_12_FULL_67_14]|nr:MAG: hypothetical protein A3H29_00655 [Acidobacteria bacterium RIFCSPLOWO2_02_FULL_67_21]OFW37223.1 MAG: hypothetical protein A3F70_12665 [Acidobacteria bacterium RIFCSPLOWO2_12_FULL_67_14]